MKTLKLETLKLGEGLDKQDNGFSGKGDWDLHKIFFNDGTVCGEFYLNINPKTLKIELVEKSVSQVELTNSFTGKKIK